MEEFCVLFGRRLAEIRKEKGIAQDKLALKCDMARSFVGEVERGKRNLSLKNICKFAIGLEVTTAELLALIDEEIKSDKYRDQNIE
jgi:transcriptional regulator with XRE-family HTH domain